MPALRAWIRDRSLGVVFVSQSEFLQLAAFTIATAYFVYVGSSEPPDGEERGFDPVAIERTLARELADDQSTKLAKS